MFGYFDFFHPLIKHRSLISKNCLSKALNYQSKFGYEQIKKSQTQTGLLFS